MTTSRAQSGRGDLRPDVHRTQIKLDGLPRNAVVLDKHGDAWQFGGMFWYRAFDGEGVSSFELAQIAQKVTVLKLPKQETGAKWGVQFE